MKLQWMQHWDPLDKQKDRVRTLNPSDMLSMLTNLEQGKEKEVPG